MIEMVVGFPLVGKEKVWLIKKERPAWQAGRLNGIGGKVEEGETPAEAMARECYEETGAVVPSWVYIGKMRIGFGESYRDDIVVYIFTQEVGESASFETKTDELVSCYDIKDILSYNTISNVPFIIHACLDKLYSGEAFKSLEIDYRG